MATQSAETAVRNGIGVWLLRVRSYWTRASTWPTTRELSILFGFLFLTCLMTWPWVTRLRDAVVDPGDPYLLSWVLWWDFHQTFTDPLHLFDANIFYPLRYTLAFTENDYGISLLFFPLFALGARPLTVNSVATFLGFAFSGYGAFRLTRTLTNSSLASWIAGIIFAFLPYRFHMMSQIHYVFAGWMPLTFEAVVLFARARTRSRAAWLAVAFTMSGLTCLTWFMLSLIPLSVSIMFLIVRHNLWRERDFWIRGGAAVVASAVALLPFLLPYYYISRTHGFTWPREMVERNSPTVEHWLLATTRNKLWSGFGANVTGGKYAFFPGLLPIVFAAVGLLMNRVPFRKQSSEANDKTNTRVGSRRLKVIDSLLAVFLTLALVVAGWSGSPSSVMFKSVFAMVTPELLKFIALILAVLRLSLAYPQPLVRATGRANLVDQIHNLRQGEALWLSGIWIVVGFLMSLGMNSWLYRLVYDYVFIFRGMREPSRAAMVASLGLAVGAGIGAAKVTKAVSSWRFTQGVFVVIILFAMLFEFRAAPLGFIRGAVYPDQLTLRLKETPMRGGIVELPTGGGELPHLYMLRAADHGKPLINAISTFVPTHSGKIDSLARETPIQMKLLDELEKVPTSYLIVHFPLIEPSRRPIFEAFLARGMASGRLQFIRRYGEGDDLYSVVKTEPEARSEAEPPVKSTVREWAAMLEADPVNLLGYYEWSRDLYLVELVAWGELPRYDKFMSAAKEVGRQLFTAVEGEQVQFRTNLSKYVERLTTTDEFRQKHDQMDDLSYVQRLLTNAGLSLDQSEYSMLVNDLKEGRKTRADVLLDIAGHPRLVAQEQERSLVLLHFFGYLRRNPNDPPDNNMRGFEHWVGEVKKHGGDEIGKAFASSIEYQRISKK